MSIAQAEPWAGKKSKKTGVVYIAAEGQGGFQKRIEAYKRHRDVKGLPFALITQAPNMGTAESHVDALAESVEARMQEMGGEVGVIVLDTLARVMAGAEENNAADMMIFIRNAQALADRFGCLVIVVHHTGKEPGKGPRGSSAFIPATDALIRIENSGDGIRTATLERQKDGESGLQMKFRLKTVVVGQDEDGERVESCVVDVVEAWNMPTATSMNKEAEKKKKEPRGGQIDVLKLVEETMNTSGRLIEDQEGLPVEEDGGIIATVPQSTMVVEREAANRMAKARDLWGTDGNSFRRHLRLLQSKGHIVLYGQQYIALSGLSP